MAKTIRLSRSFVRRVKGKVVASEESSKTFQVPSYEARDTDGGKVVTRYRRTVWVRKADGRRVKRTTRRKSTRDKY